MAQSDYYLKIDTIKGEVLAVGFEETMQISSFSFGANNAGSASLGTGMGTGKVSFQDFHFTVQNGKQSPALLLAVCKGNHIPKAVLSLRKSGGDGKPYVYEKYTFGDIQISSYQVGGSDGGGLLPQEQISFNFTRITHEYFQQKEDGRVSLTNTINYDIKKVEGSGA